MNNDIPIHFLLGFSRSGTSIIMTYLRAHPAIETGYEEPNHLFRLLTSINWSEAHEDELGISEEELERITERAINRFINVFYKELAKTTEKKVVVLKHPWLNVYIKNLIRIFPKAKVGILLRHPYDVIASCADFRDFDSMAEKMFPKDLDKLISLYLRHTKALLNVQRQAEKRIALLKFEDFIAKPDWFLRSFFNFIGVAADADTVDFILKAGDKDSLAFTARVLETTQIFKPEKKFIRMSKEDQLKIRRRLFPMVKRLNYSDVIMTKEPMKEK